MNDERQRNGQGKNQKGVEEEDHPEGTRNKIVIAATKNMTDRKKSIKK